MVGLTLHVQLTTANLQNPLRHRWTTTAWSSDMRHPIVRHVFPKFLQKRFPRKQKPSATSGSCQHIETKNISVQSLFQQRLGPPARRVSYTSCAAPFSWRLMRFAAWQGKGLMRIDIKSKTPNHSFLNTGLGAR